MRRVGYCWMALGLVLASGPGATVLAAEGPDEAQAEPAEALEAPVLLTQVKRRRPGPGAEEEQVPPAETAPPPAPAETQPPPGGAPEEAAGVGPERIPQIMPPRPGIERRRPGEEPVRRAPPRRLPEAPPLSEDERRRPGLYEPPPPEPQQPDPNQATGLGRVELPAPDAPSDFIPIPDRWRLAKDLGVVQESWLDPYNRNLLKADRPIFGRDWFFNLSVISDTIVEPRRLPTPVAPQVSRRPGDLDVFGEGEQLLVNQNLILGLVLFKGDTVFRPPDYEFRLTPVFNYNYTEVEERRLLKIDPRKGDTREASHVALQEGFVDVHIRNVSDRYDFDSFRVGIQPFSSDFRGFLFQDNQFGVRLFGTRDNNIYQYNLAWFRMIEKDTNSGLLDVAQGFRNDDIFIGNLYKQDFPVRGFTSQGTVVYNRNREGDDDRFFDNNGLLVRPAPLGFEQGRDYDVVYLGYNGDGHFGRLNLTVSGYVALGEESPGTFVREDSDIRAFFGAAEASVDYDWIRLRASVLYGSGDDDPFDTTSEGFDAIFENPIFAGADTSFWIRQAVPLIGGGGVVLSGRNAVLPALRSSKDQGQSNFTNPGVQLYGLGADLDLTPEIRLSGNFNKLFFDDTSSLEVARNQGKIDSDIGWDLSLALIYRPLFSQNIVFRLSGAVLLPGDGLKDLYKDETLYSVLGNLVLTY